MMRFLPCYQAVESMRLGATPEQAAADAMAGPRDMNQLCTSLSRSLGLSASQPLSLSASQPLKPLRLSCSQALIFQIISRFSVS